MLSQIRSTIQKTVFWYILIGLMVYPCHVAAGETIDMRPIYSFKGLRMEMIPNEAYTLPLREYQRIELFTVQADNAIGTTFGNAISLLHFVDNRIEQEVLKSDFDPYVSGVKKFMEPLSEDYMAFLQSRRILLFNLKERSHHYYKPLTDPEEYFTNMNTLDAEKKLFLLQIGKDKYRGMEEIHYMSQRVYDLRSEQAVELREFPMGTYPEIEGDFQHSRQMYITNNLIFMVDVNKEPYFYFALDGNFNRIHHPLVDVLNTHRDMKQECNWIVHPTLPFAVVMGKTKLWVVSWRDSRAETYAIVYRPRLTWDLSFSSDGKWLAIMDTYEYDRNESAIGKHVLMPIDENLPYYLGDPLDLGKAIRNDKYYWTINPSALIVYRDGKTSHLIRGVLPTRDHGD